jgi:hypothetical protein
LVLTENVLKTTKILRIMYIGGISMATLTGECVHFVLPGPKEKIDVSLPVNPTSFWLRLSWLMPEAANYTPDRDRTIVDIVKNEANHSGSPVEEESEGYVVLAGDVGVNRFTDLAEGAGATIMSQEVVAVLPGNDLPSGVITL